MGFNLKVDEKELKHFSTAMREQVPFATAVALTKTAAQAQDKIRRELPHRMIIRNQFTLNSIRFARAEKRDWPNSQSSVGSISPYMEIQEEGGVKTPISKAFAIPKGIRSSDLGLVPRSNWPGRILPPRASSAVGGRSRGAKTGSRIKPKPFIIKEQSGVGVYVRTGKGRQLKRLFRLTRASLHVKGRHWLNGPVNEVVEANLHENFVQALAKALATSTK